MIETHREYEMTWVRVAENRQRVAQQRVAFTQEGLTAEQIDRLLDPLLAFHEQMEAEVQIYERALASQVDPD